MITMHARPRQTDGRMDEYHGNSETIRSTSTTHRALKTKTTFSCLLRHPVKRIGFVLLTQTTAPGSHSTQCTNETDVRPDLQAERHGTLTT